MPMPKQKPELASEVDERTGCPSTPTALGARSSGSERCCRHGMASRGERIPSCPLGRARGTSRTTDSACPRHPLATWALDVVDHGGLAVARFYARRGADCRFELRVSWERDRGPLAA